MCSKAESTFVASRAEVSIKDRCFSSKKIQSQGSPIENNPGRCAELNIIERAYQHIAWLYWLKQPEDDVNQIYYRPA
jgi:hypothetical protein